MANRDRDDVAVAEYFLTRPGHTLGTVYELRNTKIIFEDATGTTTPCGSLTRWADEWNCLTLNACFHNNVNFDNFTAMNFIGIAEGVYMNNGKGYLLILKMARDAPMTRDMFSYQNRHLDLELDPQPNVKHAFLWLHPKRGVQIVFVTQALTCIWKRMHFNGRSMSIVVGAENGVFAVVGDDKLFFCFHWEGEEELAKPITFSPLDADKRWWRTVGDNDIKTEVKDLASYHVVIYRFF